MRKLNWFDWLTIILVIIGGLNWGLVGFFNVNVVGKIFGNMSGLSRTIYAIVGLAALYLVFAVSGYGKKSNDNM